MDQVISAADARRESDAFNAQVCSDLFRAIKEATAQGKYSLQIAAHNEDLGLYLSKNFGYIFNAEAGIISW